MLGFCHRMLRIRGFYTENVQSAPYEISYEQPEADFFFIDNEDYLLGFLLNNPYFIEDPSAAVEYYISDGKNSAEKLKSLCEALIDAPPAGILEFASGFGRVTRHLNTAYFNVTASDIHPKAMSYIEKYIGVDICQSSPTHEDFKAPKDFDVVFALSFFSHMPDKSFGRWLKPCTTA